jgi:hypothetical protein
MKPSSLLPFLAFVTACAGVKERLRDENTPQRQWERAYAEGAVDTQPDSSTGSEANSESPVPGYVLDPATDALVWTPGATHSLRANQRAGTSEGTWIPDLGYVPSPPGSTRVEWQPGLKHPARKHVIAGTREGQWVAERGYVLDDEGRARWTPGRPDPENPSMESGVAEGTWVARPEQERSSKTAKPGPDSEVPPAPAPPRESDRSWAVVAAPLAAAVRAQNDIDAEMRARGVERSDVLRDLIDQRDVEMGDAVSAALPKESIAARREVSGLALRGLESGFSGWTALGSDHSAAAWNVVRSDCPTVVDVERAAEFFVRLRRAAAGRGAEAAGTSE